jgi:hypothetical protein
LTNTWAKTEAVLSLRDTSIEGTAIAQQLQPIWPISSYVPGDGDYLILVHGYANAYGQARVSYARMRFWLERLQTNIRILELHWPGDSKRKLISKLVYSKRIGTARTCGKALAQWIAKAPKATFSIVAHSLGCRLVVHAVEELRRLDAIRKLKTICLMAAAVPVRIILKDNLGAREGESLKWRILFSRGDGVLTGAFPLGQLVGASIYWNTRFGSVAVGLTGQPQGIWKIGKSDRWEMYDSGVPIEAAKYYGHSWYWPGGGYYPKLASESGCDPSPHDDIDGRRLGNSGESPELVAQLLDGDFTRRISIRPPPPSRVFQERGFGDYVDN